MYKSGNLMFMVAQSSIHAGSGTDLGIVDMPIQREIHTGYPKIESSSVKGCIRRAFEDKVNDATAIDRLFGPENAGNDAKAGAIAFSDARILLFPIKSLKGVFAYTTCADVISRFINDAALLKANDTEIKDLAISDSPDVRITSPSSLVLKNGNLDYVVLEEYALEAVRDNAAGKLAAWLADKIFPNDNYWNTKLKQSLAILPNDVFRDFVQQFTEVIARTNIDDISKTVARGGLWYEENIPADSVMYELVMAGEVNCNVEDKGMFAPDDNMPEHEKVRKYFYDKMPSYIQIGGNATVGKGITRIQMV